MSANSLSRELLRWLQSLDLAYSIKNVKRDFSNGFLVAEIFSRYFDRAIQMHGYDNGTAIRVKKDNWGQLLKFFKKEGLNIIEPQEVTAIIHCEDGAVATFIKRVYKTLTQRDVQEVVKRPAREPPPPYMRKTGSKVIKDKLRSGALTEHGDLKGMEEAARAGLSVHESELQKEKSLDPERFSSISIAGSRAPQASRTMGEFEMEVPQVTVKEISVKQVDKNIAHLRASRDAAAVGQGMYIQQQSITSTSGGDVMPQSSLNNTGDSHVSAGSYSGQGANAILTACVSEAGFASLSAFAGGLADGSVGDGPEALQAFESIRDQNVEIAAACANGSKDFRGVSNFFVGLLENLVENSNGFKAAVETFESIGNALAVTIPESAPDMFFDVTLPSIVGILKQQSMKRSSVLRCFYAFMLSDPSDHLAAIKKLQEALDGDIPTFVHSLASLVYTELEFNDDLLDFYLYYCNIGLGQNSPSLRSGSVAMLASVLGKGGIEEIHQFLPALKSLAESDTWWETRAQLLVVCSTALSYSEDEVVVASVLEIVHLVFKATAHNNIKRIGVAYLAPVLVGKNCDLTSIFVDVLLTLRDNDRSTLLSLQKLGSSTEMTRTIDLGGGVGGTRYQLQSIVGDFSGIDVASALIGRIEDGGKKFGYKHAQILLSCVCGAEFIDEEWKGIFDGVVGMIFDSLNDEDVGYLGAQIIVAFCEKNTDIMKSVIDGDWINRSLALLYNGEGDGELEGGELCKEIFVSEVLEKSLSLKR